MNWSDAVVYQVYPRSFQDADGDGEGDLAGITARLDHIARLGADAVWLSPIYPSPMADGGYDVSDYVGIRPAFGTLADADALIAEAHRLGLKVLFDVVPCHTSIEHPWFRDRPDYYVWSDRDGPQNNWRAVFGGPAWSPDPHGRGWYLHTFYPQQPDLDWRNPAVPKAIGKALRFWLDRGVDGFRLDALRGLLKDRQRRDDPPRTADSPPDLPHGDPDAGALDQVHSKNAPDVGTALAKLRDAVGDAFLIGEVYLLSEHLRPYLEHLDVCFGFELLHAPWEAGAVRAALQAAEGNGVGRTAWVLSNHDFPRLPTRVGPEHVRAAALLLLTLPGPAFVYQGDEIGAPDGPQPAPPDDRAGRDPYRTPMPWDAGPQRGFSAGEPWLPAYGPEVADVAAAEADHDSIVHLYRDLIAARPRLGEDFALVPERETADGVLAFTRGAHLIALNLADGERPAPAAGQVLRHTHERSRTKPPATLAPGEGFLARARPAAR